MPTPIEKALSVAFKEYQRMQPLSPYEDAWVNAAITAFLKEIQEQGPNEAMLFAASAKTRDDLEPTWEELREFWNAMLAALIAQAGGE